MIGFSTLIFSVALTGINKEYIEAARMDRANGFRLYGALSCRCRQRFCL